MLYEILLIKVEWKIAKKNAFAELPRGLVI